MQKLLNVQVEILDNYRTFLGQRSGSNFGVLIQPSNHTALTPQ